MELADRRPAFHLGTGWGLTALETGVRFQFVAGAPTISVPALMPCRMPDWPQQMNMGSHQLMTGLRLSSMPRARCGSLHRRCQGATTCTPASTGASTVISTVMDAPTGALLFFRVMSAVVPGMGSDDYRANQ